MDKYNFAIDHIDESNSHGKVLSKVIPGSKVLECGCASGYMTKFLKEKLECDVSIVEIDHGAYQNARQYADDGWSGDLQREEWFNYFNERRKRFDFILFADVLEHLKNPDKVLKWAADLLQLGGKIVASIPNICHNDILIRMFYDCFMYTKIGLLDDTHIHFWGGSNIAEFCDKAGLKITNISPVIVPTGRTEQRIPREAVNPDLMKALESRQYGEIYQYVFTCELKEELP